VPSGAKRTWARPRAISPHRGHDARLKERFNGMGNRPGL